jgi:hypothetical protein
MIDSAITVPYFGVAYSVNAPGGDLKDRFGILSSIGGQFGMKFKSNIHLAVKMDYVFGKNVKEDDVLDNLRTSEGGIIEIGGQLTNPIVDMEGYSISLMGGYVLPLFGPNPNSGILITAGPCFLQHRIQIDYRDAQIPQLENGYYKGYDRLTYGLGINEFIGYIHYGKRRLINFYVGFDFMQTWTKNRRGYNYDEARYDNDRRHDNLAGFRFGWLLALHRRAPEEFYYH